MAKPRTRASLLRVATIGTVIGFGSSASASHLTTLGSVDFIDAIFASGGGSYTKSLTSGADDGWSVFAANAGDNISVTFSASTGTSGAPAAYDGAVLLEVNDGVVAVGDMVGVSNFSLDRMGMGSDLWSSTRASIRSRSAAISSARAAASPSRSTRRPPASTRSAFPAPTRSAWAARRSPSS